MGEGGEPHTKQWSGAILAQECSLVMLFKTIYVTPGIQTGSSEDKASLFPCFSSFLGLLAISSPVPSTNDLFFSMNFLFFKIGSLPLSYFLPSEPCLSRDSCMAGWEFNHLFGSRVLLSRDCVLTLCKTSRFIYSFWFYLCPRLRADPLNTEDLVCLPPAQLGLWWTEPGWMMEWEAGLFSDLCIAARPCLHPDISPQLFQKKA